MKHLNELTRVNEKQFDLHMKLFDEIIIVADVYKINFSNKNNELIGIIFHPLMKEDYYICKSFYKCEEEENK